MQITVDTHIMIHASRTHVFAWLTDIVKWPQWGGNLVSMEQTSAGSLQAGSQIRQVIKRGRQHSESIVEVTEFVPDGRFGIKAPNLKGTFTLEPIEPDTRLNARFEVEATGPIALMYKLVLKQFVMSDLRKFKTLVEATEVSGV
jgi:Polyketide cyclase / dehydrase and lipid transport